MTPSGLDLGPPPQLGYTASRINRAAGLRGDEAALRRFTDDPRAGFYLIGGELVVLKKAAESFDPLFAPEVAGAVGSAREIVFLGLLDDVPRFGINLDPASVEPLKARDDLKITDLRTIAMQGLVAAEHLPPLAEAKALLNWHARHRFCPTCGTPTRVTEGTMPRRRWRMA